MTLQARRMFSSHHPKIQGALSYVALLLVFAYPLFCKYDFSKSTLSSYDFLSMNENILWFLLLIVTATLLTLLRQSDLPLPSLFAIVFLFSIAEIYTNYPMIWRDVLLHGSAVRLMTAQGHVGGAYLKYPETQPGFFLLWSVLGIITGGGIPECNLLLLLPVALIALVLLLRSACRQFGIRIKNATTLLIFLLMNSHANEFMFMHFNTRMLSFIYVLVFVSFFLRQGDARPRAVGLVVTNIALVISHILNSLVPILFLGLTLLSRGRRPGSTGWLFLLCGITYVAWNLSVAPYLLAEGLTGLVRYYKVASLEHYLPWSPHRGPPEPLFGMILRNYYKVLLGILAMVSVYCAIRLRREMRVKILGYYLLSVFMVFGISFTALGWISVDRGVIFLSLALAALPIILLTSKWKGTSASWKRQILVVAIVVLIIPNYVLVHEPVAARWGYSGSLPEAAVFMTIHRGGQQVVSLDDFPIFYSFYEPSYGGYDNLRFEGLSSLDNVTDFLSTRTGSSLKIVDYRRVVDWGWGSGDVSSYDQAQRLWDTEVYAELDRRFNLVYSTGFETIYR